MHTFNSCTAQETPKACPTKGTALWFVTHPKMAKPLLGPFLSESDAECGRRVMRSPDAEVTRVGVQSLDDISRWHAQNNGAVMRHFASVEGGHHG